MLNHMPKRGIFHEIELNYPVWIGSSCNKSLADIPRLHYFERLITMQCPNIKINQIKKYLHCNRETPIESTSCPEAQN